MKRVLLLFTLSLCVVSLVYSQEPESSPTYRGDEALEHLKQSGQYDPLMKAVWESRRRDGQYAEPSLNDAVGQQAKFTASDGSGGDRFGVSVAVSGDTAVVGAYGDDVFSGAAYVYVRNGTTWSEQAKLIASDRAVNDFFGYSVSVSGDTAVIGAYEDDSSFVDQGSAYVFVRSGTTWSQQAKLTATDAAAGDYFGHSVSISGDTAIIGAYGDDGTFTDQGSAYVFVRSGATWSEQAKLTASDSSVLDAFGMSVAINGDTAIVGSPVDDATFSDQGSAYVFIRNGTTWSEQAKLTAADSAANDRFGWGVAISGDTVVVGTNGDDGTFTDQGSAYVFVRSGTTWSQQAKLTASDAAASDFFGMRVAISGDTAVVGAPFDDATFANQGSAYVFSRTGTTWSQQQKLTAADAGVQDEFGFSVSISGSYTFIGARNDAIGANTSQGSAYAFRVLSNDWQEEARTTASDGAAGDQFGWSVAISGDTAVVGSNLDDGTFTDQGAAYVFVRNGTTWNEQAKLLASDPAASDFFGTSLAISGDTIIVGASGDDVSFADQGSAYVFVRNGTIWSQQAKLTASDAAASDFFGNKVAISGDTAMVGAPLDDGAFTDQGSAYVFLRSGTVWSQQAKLTTSDAAAGDQFGIGVAIDGNTAVIGANLDDGAFANQGSAYVFVRNGAAWSQAHKLTASDPVAGDEFGWNVSVSGETVLVGAVGHDDTFTDQGAAYLYVRSGATWNEQAKLTATDAAASDLFGYSVSLDGDTAIVGARLDDDAFTDQGSAYVFYRNGTTWSQQQKLTGTAAAAGDQFGWSVAVSGDKIVVGTPGADTPEVGRGAAYFFVNAPFAPTVAGAPLRGRLLTASRVAVANAMVQLTATNGAVYTTRSSPFGYFSFGNLPSGETYVISVGSRHYVFIPQAINLLDELVEVELVALP